MSLESELLEVLARHGVGSASNKIGGAQSPKATALGAGAGAAASYIREIITGDTAFDERVLKQVTDVLARGTGSR